MSRESIDKAIYDKERYDSLRERGIGEERAKRVATTPIRHDEKPAAGARKREEGAKTRDPKRTLDPLSSPLKREKGADPAPAPPPAPGLSTKQDISH